MKTFRIIKDTWLKKKPIQSNDLLDSEKIFYRSGKIIPYIDLKESENNHILLTLDYGMGKWYIYTSHTDIIKNKDASIALLGNKWDETTLIKNVVNKSKFMGLNLKSQWSYIMATIQHETASTMQPVREAFWLSEEWRINNLRYYPYYGRGYVQLTWKENYRKYSKKLGIDLVSNPDKVMDPLISLFIIIDGFKNGAFTGYSIENFINNNKKDYYNARKCINGLDAAGIIENMAIQWENSNSFGIK